MESARDRAGPSTLTLGVTLPMTPVLRGQRRSDRAAPDPALTAIASAPLSLETLWFANAYRSRAQPPPRRSSGVAEAAAFRSWQGTIVELNENPPDPASMRRLSARTGLNVAAGTGWYNAAMAARLHRAHRY